MSVECILYREMELVAKDQSVVLAPLSHQLSLDESGFDSLCWAIVFSRLEVELGFDPLTGQTEFPATIGDLIMLYEKALQFNDAQVA